MDETITATDWLRVLRTDPAPRHYLVCFPPGGGSATAYRELAREIGSGVAVLAVQYPGRQDRLAEQAVPDLHALADLIAGELLARGPRSGLALFGHSMGATLAYETARRLEDGGQELTALFVSGRPTPSFAEPARLHLESDEALIADLERLAADPAPIALLRTEPGLADLVLPAVRSDYQAVETYAHRKSAPLACDLAALVGTEDPTTTPEQADEWRAFTSGGFERATFPGGHFYLDEHVGALAEFITRHLRDRG
ncbi:thioesterase II family protein [Nocardia amikacinitolerans]|uniref:thioesterase II family protein n=1 Tax=Nocardia amikacinitolerans TaxID=756689 RepID=UPI0020A58BE9|nr:alpha/beta fold hydrolase [Nocardia amikacinitolerans]MCP2275798.1 Surfactin synthase thioesterase subunit [Nocardia amikacinitolerans]MCP2294069.1 Surfactin synthase thioesterase subunit [Nocardia amikacinitolerans]